MDPCVADCFHMGVLGWALGAVLAHARQPLVFGNAGLPTRINAACCPHPDTQCRRICLIVNLFLQHLSNTGILAQHGPQNISRSACFMTLKWPLPHAASQGVTTSHFLESSHLSRHAAWESVIIMRGEAFWTVAWRGMASAVEYAAAARATKDRTGATTACCTTRAAQSSVPKSALHSTIAPVQRPLTASTDMSLVSHASPICGHRWKLSPST